MTRAAHQAGPLCRALEGAGARVEPLPLLEVLPGDSHELRQAAAALQPGHWVVFTSSNAVDAFLPKVPAGLRLCLRLAAVGPATARAIRAYGSEPRLQAQRSDGEGLFRALKPHLGPSPKTGLSPKILVPQADDARPALVEGLRQLEVELQVVVAYRKALPTGGAEVGPGHLCPRAHRLGDVYQPPHRAAFFCLGVGGSCFLASAHRGGQGAFGGFRHLRRAQASGYRAGGAGGAAHSRSHGSSLELGVDLLLRLTACSD